MAEEQINNNPLPIYTPPPFIHPVPKPERQPFIHPVPKPERQLPQPQVIVPPPPPPPPQPNISKKKPGRPRKSFEKLPVHGVLSHPPTPNNHLTFASGDPHELRDLFEPFFDYRMTSIMFFFEPNAARMLSMVGGIKIMADISINNAHKYYCADNTIVSIECDQLKTVLATIHAYTTMIEFSMSTTDHGTKMLVYLRDISAHGENRFELRVVSKPDGVFYRLEENKYPLSFTFDTDYFKLFVSKVVYTIADNLHIQKNGLEPLRFFCNKGRNDVTWSCKYAEEKKISLVSTIEENDILLISLDIRQIHPLACCKVGKRVRVFVDKRDPIVFLIAITDRDETFSIGIIRVCVDVLMRTMIQRDGVILQPQSIPSGCGGTSTTIITSTNPTASISTTTTTSNPTNITN